MTPEEHSAHLEGRKRQALEQLRIARERAYMARRKLQRIVIRAVALHMALFLFACWMITQVTPYGWAWWVNIGNAVLNIGFALNMILRWLPKEPAP